MEMLGSGLEGRVGWMMSGEDVRNFGDSRGGMVLVRAILMVFGSLYSMHVRNCSGCRY